MTYSATYSPDDNKIRLYASTRLDAETYARAKAAGFRWAPKQDLFFAYWSPAAEDLATELAGEIDDDDKSLADRAEDRADRFEGYSEKRTADAERARQAVAAIADNIPLGQPILVGHHSEKRARKDAERIENGMRKAVKMWETAGYWSARAAGAVRAAKYKELPAVRARRIKTLEADLRKVERNKALAEKFLKAWQTPGLTFEQAKTIANHEGYSSHKFPLDKYPRKEGASTYEGDMSLWSALDGGIIDAAQAAALAIPPRVNYLPRAQRWIDHYNHRLDYERAMLADQGATALLDPKPRRELAPILNYRAKTGRVDYENPYNRGTVISLRQLAMTKAQYAKVPNDYRGARLSLDKSHRFRTAMGVYADASLRGTHEYCAIFLTDSKDHGEPAPQERPAESHPAAAIPTPRERPAPTEPKTDAAPFEAMRESLKAGVKVVSAPQLFPTPAALAARVVEAADIQPGHRVLEPSAGTGALLAAVPVADVVCVEISQSLADALRRIATDVHCADFLSLTPDNIGTFDRVIMNPPFTKQADIRHVIHAAKFLKPGGRLVAIMSAGVTFRTSELSREFHQLVCDRRGTIVDLPEGSFAEAGTAVRAVLVTLDAPRAAKQPDELAGQLALL